MNLPPIRHTARVLLLDAAGSVLLVRYDEAKIGQPSSSWWATPGGALEAGETHEEAALRELAEETGLSGQISAELWESRFEHSLAGPRVFQIERFFLVRLDRTAPAVFNSSPENISELRWWSPTELTATREQIYPEHLADAVNGLLRDLQRTDPALGLESRVVRLAEYDARWPGLYRAEAARIGTALHPLSGKIEHIGSTAVHGLVAKPILDILVGYEDSSFLPRYIETLARSGYEHRGESGVPGRQFFRRGNPRAYHIHLALINGPFWRDHIAFRDVLRRDAAVRDVYAALKRELARKHSTDRETYIEKKGGFVADVLSKTTHAPPEG